MTITAIYAGLATFLFVYLSFRVIGKRQRDKISLGDANDKDMGKRIRVHGNFAEYAPLSLLLLGLAEMQNTAVWLLHLIGLSILIGRILHAYGLGKTPQILNLRIAGMILTLAAMIVAGVTNLVMAIVM